MPGQQVKRLLTYTQESLEEALQSIKNGTMKVCQAAEVYGISKSTLSDRITSKREVTVGHHGR